MSNKIPNFLNVQENSQLFFNIDFVLNKFFDDPDASLPVYCSRIRLFQKKSYVLSL